MKRWNLIANKAQENDANACLVATQSFNEGSHLPREFSPKAWYFLAR